MHRRMREGAPDAAVISLAANIPLDIEATHRDIIAYLGEIDKLFTLQSSRLHLFAVVLLAYAAVEGIEAVGLWYQRRWAEYLTFLVTASLLPFEVYEISTRTTPFKVIAFLINVAVVVYLLYAKRLFGLRGGAAADEALARRDYGWEALERTAPPV